MKKFNTSRGMVSVHPGLIALAVVLIGLVAWKTVVRVNLIDEVKPFNAAKLRSQTITGGVTTPLICMALAGGVGAGCYFAFGKSQRAANAGMMVVMVLACGTFSYQMYAYLTRDTSAQPVPAGNGNAGQGASANPNVVPSPPANRMQPNGNRAGASAPAAVSSATPPAGAPAGAPAAAPVAVPVPPVVVPPKPAIDVKPILDPIRAEYAAKCEALAVKAEEAFKAAAKPRKEVKFLDESIALFAEVKTGAETLEAEMRGLSDVTRAALEQGGMDMGEAMRAAIEFDKEFNEFDRIVACGELSRFAERAGELFTIIKDNRAKVQIDAKGEATSKERTIETQLFHARSPMGFAVKAKDGTLKKVRGEK